MTGLLLYGRQHPAAIILFKEIPWRLQAIRFILCAKGPKKMLFFAHYHPVHNQGVHE
jgi:hypothetical protein